MSIFKSAKNEKIDLSLVVFRIVFLFLIFILGGEFAIHGWQPFKFFYEGLIATRTFIQEKIQAQPLLLKKKKYNAEGVIKYDPDQAYDGFTVLQGTLPGGTQIRLIDMFGNEIHRWPVKFYEIWPEPKHLEEKYWPKTEFNYYTQGMHVLSDGSVIINIDDKGAVKLDKCGNVEWSVYDRTHHSITIDENGSFWIPSQRIIKNIPDHLIFPRITKEMLEIVDDNACHSYENLIILVDQKGKIQKKFSVLQALYDGGFESEIYDIMLIKPTDPTHINDIEIVTQPLADKIPNVNKGDLLVSIRQMHMLAILDSSTGEIKWHHTGPWIRQHDPDITPEGNIVVFNNGSDQLYFDRIPGSNLIEFNPETSESRIIYPQNDQEGFYTDIMGTHELLPNGNRLIVESRAGRVFEINKDGEIVWDYVLPYDETYASLITSAQRLSKDYFTFDDWQCN